MHAPLTGYGSLLALTGIVLGFTGSALSARADQLVCRWGGLGRAGPNNSVLDRNSKRSRTSPTYQSSCASGATGPSEEDEEDEALSESDRAVMLELLARSVMMLSPFMDTYGPVPPLVVKPPPPPAPSAPPAFPPSAVPPPDNAPEPTSLLTGLFGSGLLGALAWRRRRKKEEVREGPDAPNELE